MEPPELPEEAIFVKKNPLSVFNRLSGRYKLFWHLLAVVVLKIILLIGLWHIFIKPYRVKVDAGQMAARITGSNNPLLKENIHD